MDRTKIIAAFPRDPDGEGFFMVVAETKRGNRYVLAGYVHRDEARVTKMAADIEAFGSINLDLWNETYPCYGSAAYEEEAAEAHQAAEMIRGGYAHESDFSDNIRTLL